MANFKEQKKYHFTYKTTNLINNRYYLGMHSTNRIDDGYLGSGKRLYYELNKYGRDNFKFEILEHFNSREQLVQAEINLITEHDLENPNCLNCKPGGEGGLSSPEHAYAFHAAGGKAVRILMSNRHRERMKTDLEYKARVLQKTKDTLGGVGPFTGKKHTSETLKKMKGHTRQQGEKNSQYGKPRSEETKQKIRDSLKKTRELKNKD